MSATERLHLSDVQVVQVNHWPQFLAHWSTQEVCLMPIGVGWQLEMMYCKPCAPWAGRSPEIAAYEVHCIERGIDLRTGVGHASKGAE